ncbi:MAG: hypothetical protein ACJ77F_07505 [Chloroflexota bacterium]
MNTSDLELDRILTVWLTAGDEAAPADDVEAALGQVAVTPQRRPLLARLPRLRGELVARQRWLVVLAVLLLAAGLAAAGLGSGVIRLDREPVQPPPTAPSVSPVPATIDLRGVRVADFSSAVVSLPSAWTELERPCCDSRLFGGDSPVGTITIGNESPYWTSVCNPTCHEIDVEMSIPYSASDQVERLRAAVADIAGSDDWKPLPAGVLVDLEDGVQLETTLVVDGVEYRSRYLVGHVARNAAAITWTQPSSSWDAVLLDRVLASMTLPPAPVYSDGDLVEVRVRDSFSMSVPGTWQTFEQPLADGKALSGVQQELDGRVLVSIGDPDGTLGWCDPDCRRLSGATTIDNLEELIRSSAPRGGEALSAAEETTLDGEPARTITTNDPAPRAYVIALHNGRPIALFIDSGDWDVAPGTVEQMIASFAFLDPLASPGSASYVVGGGTIDLHLDERWRPTRDEGAFTTGDSTLLVRVGSDDGHIRPCDKPAGPWDPCEEIHVTTLEELAAAVQADAVQDHGVGPFPSTSTNGTLGGEPCVIVRTVAYEHPARSGQEVAYVVAFHDGRPVIVRYWTSRNEIRDLASVIAGVTFKK